MSTIIKVVVVEDDLDLQYLYRLKLEREGFEVATASNGLEGLEIIQKFQPEIVLLDLMMPVMTGEEMLAKLRATDWGKDIKVIILTNRGEQEIPPEVKQLGVTAIILKADMTPRQVAELVKTKLAE